ncbi:hypothetical protein F0344_23740 [Streptomyces finlayi]|uniref:DUF5753 domain-containing protein n=2 Tax=Streptomyces finlayi TaxID=67296 RepID=A0A7G7BPF3_9ACTN|nr:hypothetical protein F0344_23740 [Streptomyces finlayi]
MSSSAWTSWAITGPRFPPAEASSIIARRERTELVLPRRRICCSEVRAWRNPGSAGFSQRGSQPVPMCSRGVRREWLTILRFPLNRDGSESEPPTVYADGYTGDLYLDKPTEVASYDAAFKDIRDKAIDDQASQNLISEVAGSYGQG